MAEFGTTATEAADTPRREISIAHAAVAAGVAVYLAKVIVEALDPSWATIGFQSAANVTGAVLGTPLFVYRVIRYPRQRLAWSLVAFGLLATAVPTFEVLVDGRADSWVSSASFFGLVMGVGGGLLLLSSVPANEDRILRVDLGLVGFSGIAIWIMLLTDPDLGVRAGTTLGAETAEVIATTAPVALTMIWVAVVRFVFVGGFARTGYRWIVVGAMAVVVTAPQRSHAVFENDELLASLFDVTPLTGLLWAAAAVHPSTRAAFSARPPSWSPWRAAVPLIALVAPALLMTMNQDGLRDTVLYAFVLLGAIVLLAYRSRLTIEELVDAKRQVEHQAVTDDLTGLSNRRGLTHAVGRAGPRPLRLVFLDIDRFKLINDVHGHVVGDQVLEVLARRLRSQDGPLAVGRIGGDEFGVLYAADNHPARWVDEEAESLRRLIAEPIEISNLTLHVTVSAGVSGVVGAQDPTPLDTAFHQADTALHEAKRTRARTPIAYATTYSEQMQRTAQVLGAVLGQDPGASAWLEFQPIVELSTERTVAEEALARCATTALGVIGPGEFIPLAEQSGAMESFGNLVLDLALDAIANERAGGDHHRLAINISPFQLSTTDLGDRLRDLVDADPAVPDHLFLEVTETALLDQARATQIERIAELGFHLVVDDFGSEYASLASLFVPGVELLKIDRSFVADMVNDRRRRAVITRLLQVANDLDLDVIAEGIETREQADLLADMGCRYGQGYLWGMPRPAAASA